MADLWPMTRRRFLAYAALAGGVIALDLPRAATSIADAVPVFTLIPTFSTWVRRRDDLVSIKLDCYFLVLNNSDPLHPKLVRKAGAKEAFVVATFWPQNVSEETFDESSVSPAPGPAPIRSILANQSRLAFFVPDTVTSIPLDFSSVLDWSGWAQRVTPVARTDGPRDVGSLTEPSFLDTAIENPYRLILSPSELSHWTSAGEPVTHDGWTELWHTRMDEKNPERRLVRAVWTRDLSFPNYLQTGIPPGPGDRPFTNMTLEPHQRANVVLNSSIEVLARDRVSYTPLPITVNRLMLTALGGWIDSDAVWEEKPRPFGNDLLEWKHQGTLGRDHYVKVVEEGYFLPFGHPAVKITISERKFNFDTGGQLGAYVRKREFLVVRQPEKLYSSVAQGPLAPGQQHDGRAIPFRSVKFKTLVTPDLDLPLVPFVPVDGADGGEPTFVPLVAGSPFLFHAVATDWGNLITEFTTPVVFVPGHVAFLSAQTTVNNAITQWNTVAVSGLQDRPFASQRVNFAEVGNKADTSLQADSITFGVEGPFGGTGGSTLSNLERKDQPPFYPTVSEAQVRLAAAEQIKGGQLDPPRIKIAQIYIDNGFDLVNNKGHLYAEVVSAPVALKYAADKSGGGITPNLGITGLSRALGPVGDNAGIASGSFDPATFFGGSDAKILGGLELVKILAKVAFGVDSDGVPPPETPKMDTQTLFKDGLVMPDDEPPKGIHTTFKWKPKLKPDPLNIFVPDVDADPDNAGKAELNVDITTDLATPDNSTFEIKGEIDNFTVNLFGTSFKVLILHFKDFKFTIQKGSSPDVDVDIDAVHFAGVLMFVEELKNYLASTGYAPTIDIAPTGVKVGYSIPIPGITAGAFSLTHVKLGASMTLPFSAKPVRFRFEFCTRENPFLLTIYIFGGGGFFAIGVGTDGFEILEAALEFGVAAAIDLGVASGSAKIVVGIYFKLEEKAGPPQHQETSLTGYFRAHGEVSVMGIISITIEIYLGFTYEFDTNKCTGTATVSIDVHIIFFSISVSVTVERKFGGNGDPRFIDAVPDQATWNEYADAFAPLSA